MSKQLRDLRKRQEDRARSKSFYEVPDIFEIYREACGLKRKVESKHPKNTLGYFADELSLPPALLIQQFSDAGIGGLTIGSLVQQKDKNALLSYLKLCHASQIPPVAIYEHQEISSFDITTVSNISLQLVAYLSKNPEAVYSLPPRKFEELIAFLLERQGCEINLTKSTRDGGYDIWAKMRTPISDVLILAECKRYERTNKVGVEVVRGLYGVTEAHRANQGIIVTSSFFTKDAHEEQLRIGSRISLRDFSHLSKWLADCS